MALEDSILKSTKKKLNVNPDDTSFDLDIIDNINTAFSHLQQLGVGPRAGFQIEDDQAKWSDFLSPPDPPDPAQDTYLPVLNAVKTNVALRVRLIFDPPQLAHVMAALQQQLQESDWRVNVLREETDWVNPNPPVPAIYDPYADSL